MTEYEARGTTARITDNELILAPARGNAAQKEALTRRIPYGAIREVIFRESRLSDSVLALVLGATPRPARTGAWSADVNPDALAFKPGKQSRGARELCQRLEAEVAAARVAGVDPQSVSYDLPPTGEDQLRAVNHRKLDTTVLRADVAVAVKNLTEIPKRIRTIIEEVGTVLDPGEQVEALTSGAAGSAIANFPALLVVTDKRAFVFSGSAPLVADELRRSDISSVAWQQGIVGKLDITGNGHILTLRAPDTGATEPLVRALRSTLGDSSAAPRGTEVDQLERLVALLNAGALTHSEFEQQKAKILGR